MEETRPGGVLTDRQLQWEKVRVWSTGSSIRRQCPVSHSCQQFRRSGLCLLVWSDPLLSTGGTRDGSYLQHQLQSRVITGISGGANGGGGGDGGGCYRFLLFIFNVCFWYQPLAALPFLQWSTSARDSSAAEIEASRHRLTNNTWQLGIPGYKTTLIIPGTALWWHTSPQRER